jgi:RNA polymerase sigma factor for flagellar operon FliA
MEQKSHVIQTRDELIESCRALVIFSARRLSQTNGPMEFEDAISEGFVGLVRAANNFDASRGVKFSTYAATCINGAIIDALRRLSPGSRQARRENRSFEQSRTELTAMLGREPGDAELAERLHLSRHRLDDVHRYMKLQLVSMDSDADGVRESDIAGVEDTERDVLSQMEAHELRQQIACLLPREREIIHRHYIKGHSQREIAVDLGVSESRISQIQRRALLHLRLMQSEQAPHQIAI